MCRADLTVVDRRRERWIEESWIVRPRGWTPFAGQWPVMRVVLGVAVMREDEVVGRPMGRVG